MVRHPKAPVDDTAGKHLAPVRGLVLGQNHRATSFGIRDLRRWLRIHRIVFKTDKVDLLFTTGDALSKLPRLLEDARRLDLRLSLRTDCALPPPDLAALCEAGLLDLFLTPQRLDDSQFEAWLDAASSADLPVRVQICAPFTETLDSDVHATRLRDTGVTVVNLAAYDPFLDTEACTTREQSERAVDTMLRLARACETVGIEANLLHIPFCLVDRNSWPQVHCSPQFFADHQHYREDSYELAHKISSRSPIVAGKILSMFLGKHTLFDDPIDNKLLPWLLEAPWLRARIVAWHKLTRHLRLVRSVPIALPEDDVRAQRALDRKRRKTIRELGSLCGICSLRHICDRQSSELRQALPGLEVTPQDGDVTMYPLQFAGDRPRYYDAVDRVRLARATDDAALVKEANAVVSNSPPDLEIDAFSYETEGQWCHQLPGGVRWFGFTNSEKISTPLAMLDPPFTISVVFGGGIAEYIGFALGRDCKLVCPMEAYGHTITLHVARDGRYVLLRDGEAVQPVTFEGHYYAPLRLGHQLEPRISIFNIDHSIVTQNVAVWSPDLCVEEKRATPKFTFLTVCVRYARRLQAVLQSIAHQQGIDPGDIEIIVAYVPGVDSTEDVLEALSLAHPTLHIHRSTFTQRKARAKGFIINESLQKAGGDWVVLLDADTLIPPDFCKRLLEHTDQGDFIVPDGRKLLSRETTARVLLGEIRPWESWNELLHTGGEFRHREMEGVPIGFCQAVRRSCFDTINYYEADHFEGADWQFSIDMRNRFGNEIRLSGVPVLHLDHGGSKWYGAERHF